MAAVEQREGPPDDADAGPPKLGAGGGREIERLVFFSDAVMAIAMTLLVIDLRLPGAMGPEATDAELRAALGDLGQSFLGVLLSFMVIAVWWLGHDRLFRAVSRADGALLVLNFAFLGAIAFIPFPTALIGRYVDLPSAVILYAATNAVAGSALLLMRWHAGRRGFIAAEAPLERRHRLAAAAPAPLVFALSIPVAVIDSTAGALSWLAIIPAVLAVRWWFERALRRAEASVEAPAEAPAVSPPG